MDYNTLCTIISEQCGQILSQQNIDTKVRLEVQSQIYEVSEKAIGEQFEELKENFKILNQQVLILREAVESAINKYNDKKCN